MYTLSLSTSTTLAQHYARQDCLFALAQTSASLGASTFDGCIARGTSRWKCHPFHIPLCIKPGVHTNDFVPIYGRRANKLGHASLTTVFRHSRLTFQPILQENLESPLLRYQAITTAVVTDACLNTRWHHGIYIICPERVARYGLGRDNVRGSVGAMNAELSRPDLIATVQLVRKQA